MTAPRLVGLDDESIKRIIAAAQALEMGRTDRAADQLRVVLTSHPNHPEVLRLHAGLLSLFGDHPRAIAVMQRALALRPGDPLYYNTMGSVYGSSGDLDGAIRALSQACKLQPDLTIAWYNLAVMLVRCVRNEEATDAVKRAVALAPGNMDARALLGDLLRMRGEAAASAAEYRKVLAERPCSGMAWWGLADLRIGAFEPGDIKRMQTALHNSLASENDRVATGFALATALDAEGHLVEALAALKDANTIARSRLRWNAAAFSKMVDAINEAFTPPPASIQGSNLGCEVLFIVGLPRSGTTLVEQIFASHSQVEGSGELPDLSLVLGEESRRRGQLFPHWVTDANMGDWQRLGERYLERTAYWRKRRPRFTDKLPGNWMYIGAIRAMLPGAHVVVCRRNPLETCFSCYRQLLPDGNEFSRTPEDLAAFWRDFDRAANHWAALHPSHVYQHDYETLVATPEPAIRGLLEASGLSFEESCLHSHATEREVRSPSATQVRRPLQADTARTQQYGELLDPLRISLGLPNFEA